MVWQDMVKQTSNLCHCANVPPCMWLLCCIVEYNCGFGLITLQGVLGEDVDKQLLSLCTKFIQDGRFD